MTQRRILVLDDDALVLVVDKDVVHKVDEKRGEMTRSEFVNFLIQSQLKDSGRRNYVEKEEFHHFVQDMKDTLRNFLDFMLGWALEQEQKKQSDCWAEWLQKIETLNAPADPEAEST